MDAIETVSDRDMPCSISYDEQPSGNGSLSLPPEILVEIFLHCLPSDRARLSKPPQLLPPFILARVCAHWRTLVISSPQLWNRIILGRNETDSAREMSLFDAWLVRAGSDTVPLDIKLVPQLNDALQVLLDREANDKYDRDTTALIKTFCANAHRWRTLVLNVLDAVVLERLFTTLSSESNLFDSSPTSTVAAPLLETLKITSTHLGSANGARTLHNIALTCPRLRSVSLMCSPIFPAPTQTLRAPVLQNMSMLELRFCTVVSHALSWINICPNLEHLKLHLFCSTTANEEDPEIVEFDGLDEDEEIERSGGLDGEDAWVLVPRPRSSRFILKADARVLTRLTHLELRSFSFASPVGAVLDLLTTPALRTLKINTYVLRTDPNNARWLHVSALLLRSRAPLEELEITGTPMNVDDVRSCLLLSPQLKRLSVRKLEELDTLLRDLTVPKSEPGSSAANYASGGDSEQSAPTGTTTLLCPELEVLEVADSSFSVDVLVSMVLSRFASPKKTSESDGLDVSGCTRLKELCVDTQAASTVEAEPVIAMCISQGLKFTKLEADLLLSLRVD